MTKREARPIFCVYAYVLTDEARIERKKLGYFESFYEARRLIEQLASSQRTSALRFLICAYDYGMGGHLRAKRYLYCGVRLKFLAVLPEPESIVTPSRRLEFGRGDSVIIIPEMGGGVMRGEIERCPPITAEPPLLVEDNVYVVRHTDIYGESLADHPLAVGENYSYCHEPFLLPCRRRTILRSK